MAKTLEASPFDGNAPASFNSIATAVAEGIASVVRKTTLSVHPGTS